jgi:hypothetical protein
MASGHPPGIGDFAWHPAGVRLMYRDAGAALNASKTKIQDSRLSITAATVFDVSSI